MRSETKYLAKAVDIESGVPVDTVSDTHTLGDLAHYAAQVYITNPGTIFGTLYIEITVNGFIWETLDSVDLSGGQLGNYSQIWIDKMAPYSQVRVRWNGTAPAGTLLDIVLSAKGDE